MTLLDLGIVWALALAVSLAVTGFASMAGLGDVPGARSSHQHVTPTAGGLGLIAGLGAACLILPYFEPLAPLLALIFGVAIVGLSDDMFGMHPRIKLLALIVLASLAVRVTGAINALPLGSGYLELPLWLGFAGSVLWIIVVVNAVNFMDGINGLMAGVMLAALMGFAGITAVLSLGPALLLAVALIGALTGFLPYNFRRRALIFAGDTGALTVGFIYALLPLMLSAETGPRALYLAPLLILPLLADVFMTLVRRLRRGERLSQAHRRHLYQIAARRFGHLPVATVYMLSVVPLISLALFALGVGWEGSLLSLLAIAALFALMVLGMSRHWEHSEEAQERRSTT